MKKKKKKINKTVDNVPYVEHSSDFSINIL